MLYNNKIYLVKLIWEKFILRNYKFNKYNKTLCFTIFIFLIKLIQLKMLCIKTKRWKINLVFNEIINNVLTIYGNKKISKVKHK